MTSVEVFAPGSVGNVGCGFDVLGLALEAPGDRVRAGRAEGRGVRIVEVTGDDGRIPREAERNSAGVAVRALLDETDAGTAGVGIELTLKKGLPLSGGMGGSGASAVAAVVAVDALLALASEPETLLRAALAGEEAASGGPHADNVAPSLMGGIVLTRPDAARPVVRLPVPDGLAVALLHPAQELETRSARGALPASIPLETAIGQWGNTAALVAALYEGDLELLADSLEDRVAEPVRASRVPGFQAVKRTALEAGALGCTLSGAGPSIFALCATPERARRVGDAMMEAYREDVGPGATLHRSPVGRRGARIVDGDEAGGG